MLNLLFGSQYSISGWMAKVGKNTSVYIVHCGSYTL